MHNENKSFTNYENKRMQTCTHPGITIIILDDAAKRGGDSQVMEKVRYGVLKEEQERAEVWAILKNKGKGGE